MQENRNNRILKEKLVYTALIICVYILGKSLPLYGIDVLAYTSQSANAESILVQAISGDRYRCSLFALGISPYMISSTVMQIVTLCRSSETKARSSPKKTNRMTLAITLVLAIFQAVVQAKSLLFAVEGDRLLLAQMVAAVEMVTGAMVILWLSERNKMYGIGGQTTLILVNIADGIITTLKDYEMKSLIVPLLVSVVVMTIVVVMENTEKRIPLQRISIHNVYADKNYLAIKLNPIGVMPAMFSTAFFMLPQLLIAGLEWLFPQNADIRWWKANLVLSRPLGIGAYILILYCLTIGFSRVFVNPKGLTEQFLKSGDSILNLHAGRDTKKYLSREIGRLSFFSATVMSICLGVPMVLQLMGSYENSLTTFPSSIMMLTGMWCNLYREVSAVRDLDAYQPFI